MPRVRLLSRAHHLTPALTIWRQACARNILVQTLESESPQSRRAWAPGSLIMTIWIWTR